MFRNVGNSSKARTGINGAPKSARSGSIYLGKGKIIQDNPDKYPDKDSIGVGGWAGGEKGLQKFLSEATFEDGGGKVSSSNSRREPAAISVGNDKIYVGNGQYIQDDDRIYPSKENAGILTGATGGFAGGELGLQHFNATNSLIPASQDVVRKRQAKKDALAIVGLLMLSSAGYLGYRYSTGQHILEPSEILSLAQQVPDAVRIEPGELVMPSFSKQQVEAILGLAAVVASIFAFKAGIRGLTDAGVKAKAVLADNAAKLLVLGGACAIYALLLK